MRVKKKDLSDIREKELYFILENNFQSYTVGYNFNSIFFSNNSFARLTFKRVSSNEFKVKGDYKILSFVILIPLFILGIIPALIVNVLIWHHFQRPMEKDIIQLFTSIDSWSFDKKLRIEF